MKPEVVFAQYKKSRPAFNVYYVLGHQPDGLTDVL